MNNDSLLPIAVQDLNNLTLENCFKKLMDIDIKKFIIYPIENLEEEKLAILAKEFHCLGLEGWNLCTTKEQKQNLIINSLPNHAKKGSIPSIKNALENLGITCAIKEFFEYNGRIGHFKIEFLNIFDRGLDENFEKNIKGLINHYKPKSRILDSINYFLCSRGFLFAYARNKTIETAMIKTREVIL